MLLGPQETGMDIIRPLNDLEDLFFSLI
jgi:hypothetical protein